MTAESPLSDWLPSPSTHPLSYPGKIPPWSYLLAGGRVRRIDGREPFPDLESRTAVLASGSNAAPARLAEKCGVEAVVPVERVVLPGVVVFSAHITRYGSIGATWTSDETSTCWVHVPFLDAEQLARVDASEGNYRRDVIGTVPGRADLPLAAYVSARGLLRVGGSAVRLAEVGSTSELPAMTQRDALTHVASVTGAAADARSLALGVRDGTIDPARVNRELAAR